MNTLSMKTLPLSLLLALAGHRHRPPTPPPQRNPRLLLLRGTWIPP
jgi:hypothetical protein